MNRFYRLSRYRAKIGLRAQGSRFEVQRQILGSFDAC